MAFKIDIGGGLASLSSAAPRKARLVAVLSALALAWLAYRSISPGANGTGVAPGDFEYSVVRPRDIKSQVSASGNINPVNVVSVGAQVSGIVRKIYVDYNDMVEKDQLLAEIDKAVLIEEVNSTSARLVQAKAKYDLAKLNRDRTDELFRNGYIAKVELDQAETELASANSDYVSANANYEKAKLNLNYAEIRSPVSGTVISRDVEEGQTIASSFSAPTLFKIAEDLSKMQIGASISEADIGSIRSGQSVDFSVDAFPLKNFKGVVDQVRLNPKTEQNVVIYNVIIGIENKSGDLLPGMTAFVEINTSEKSDVLAVENQALQYRPDEGVAAQVIYPDGSRRIQAGEGFVYRFGNDGKLHALRIRKGITDGAFTEIISDEIGDGDKLVSEYNGSGRKPSGAASPAVRPGGGRRRGPI